MPSCRKLALVVALASSAAVSVESQAADYDISSVNVDIGGWVLVPTMHGSQVSSFVGILPPASVVADNVAIMWFRRGGEGTWESFAWDIQDYSAAIQYVVDYYGIPLDQADWPVTVNPTSAKAPDEFGTNVFPDDPLADAIAASSDPDATVNALTVSGWQSSMLPVWLKASCSKEEHLETISAIVEADIASSSDGALASLLGAPGYQCGEWGSDILVLDSSGTTIVPNFGEIQPYSDVPAGTTYWQSITPGTLLTAPQSTIVSLGYSSGGVSTTTHNKVLSVLDVHAPDVVITPNATAEFRDVPSRLSFLVAPETISFSAAGIDAVEGLVSVAMTLNGDPYMPDTVIDRPGVYVLRATAADSKGNFTEEVALFEIRDLETYETAVIVEDLQDFYSATGELEQVFVTVLIASHGFDVKDLHLATLQASLLDESGSFVTFNAKPNGIAFSRQGDGTFAYDPLAIDIEIERGYMRVPFSIDTTGLGLTGLPPEIMISGASSSARSSVAFDFVEFISTEASDDPESDLEALDLLDDLAGPSITPGFDPDYHCNWEFVLQLHNKDYCYDEDSEAQSCGLFGGGYLVQEAQTRLHDNAGRPTGRGHARDDTCYDSAESDCSVQASVRLFMWLRTTSSGNQCEITLHAVPSFTVRAWGEGGGIASVGAHINISAGGQSSTAEGGSAFGPSGQSTTFPLGPWNIPVPASNRRGSPRPYSGIPIDYTFNTCALGVGVSSGGFADVFANGRLSNARSEIKIYKATPGVNIDAVVINGPCDGKRRTEYYR